VQTNFFIAAAGGIARSPAPRIAGCFCGSISEFVQP